MMGFGLIHLRVTPPSCLYIPRVPDDAESVPERQLEVKPRCRVMSAEFLS